MVLYITDASFKIRIITPGVIILFVWGFTAHLAICYVAGLGFELNDCRAWVCELNPSPTTLLMEIDHEIIPTAILPLLLTEERQLSVTGESLCTKWLTI